MLNRETVHIDLDILLDLVFRDGAGFPAGFEIDHHIPAFGSLFDAIDEPVQRVTLEEKGEFVLCTGYGIFVELLPREVGIQDRVCGGAGFCLLVFSLVDF
jgi:hypothetical protein